MGLFKSTEPKIPFEDFCKNLGQDTLRNTLNRNLNDARAYNPPNVFIDTLESIGRNSRFKSLAISVTQLATGHPSYGGANFAVIAAIQEWARFVPVRDHAARDLNRAIKLGPNRSLEGNVLTNEDLRINGFTGEHSRLLNEQTEYFIELLDSFNKIVLYLLGKIKDGGYQSLDDLVTTDDSSQIDISSAIKAFYSAPMLKGLYVVFFSLRVDTTPNESDGRLWNSFLAFEEEFAKILEATKSVDVRAAESRQIKESPKYQAALEKSISAAEGMAELNSLIGLSKVKEEVQRLYDQAAIQVERRKAGLPVNDPIGHLVFTGNPGTGKTTVARMLAQIYSDLGILSKGHIVEVSRVDLVGGFTGQTAIKTQQKISQAMGGILFIDEAYSLAPKSEQDFGPEAIETILKAMEDFREDFVVVVAGYSSEMRHFIDSNTGLKSRFTRFWEFEDYSDNELLEVLSKFAKDDSYELDDAAKKFALNEFAGMKRSQGFANARVARNIFERAVQLQSVRLKNMKSKSKSDLVILNKDDFLDKSRERTDEELAKALVELDSLVGLHNVKKSLSDVIATVKTNKLRREQDLPTLDYLPHMVFSGNPGTGKTTIARIVGEALKAMGALEKGQVIEVDRAALVAEVVGRTAQKTLDKCKDALGGVLFIDEAYSLISEDSESDYGHEAIETLLKFMEDHRGEMVVIAAGYEGEMREFIDSNPGLSSRFDRVINFEDYRTNELTEIFARLADANKYDLDVPVMSIVETTLANEAGLPGFANARNVRNLFERVVAAQSQRVQTLQSKSKSDLETIFAIDVSAATNQRIDPDFNLENYLDEKSIEGSLRQKIIDFVSYSQKIGPAQKLANHLIFLGNPGTGKTYTAEVMGEIFRALGLLSRGHVVSVTRANLVSGFAGTTAKMTQDIVRSAQGGVLFIDEAYQLKPQELSAGGDPGQESIDTLLREMEFYRNDLVVIVAGYTNLMERFLESNPGLSSRFPNKWIFSDKSEEELADFFSARLKELKGTCDLDALNAVKVMAREEIGREGFGNLRWSRNLAELAIRSASTRDQTPDGFLAVIAADLRETKETQGTQITLEDGLAELNALIGLSTAKKEISDLVELYKFNKKRKESGKPEIDVTKHLVFAGPPGTGKTTTARLLGKIYRSLDLLSIGHVVECSRADLVAGYVGQTAIKTKEILEKANGGVLFIDEAYTLSQSGNSSGSDFGREAIETIMKYMEDNRDDIAIVIAGYTDLISDFLESNPGLRSRFPKVIEFEAFDSSEFKESIRQNLESFEIEMDEQAEPVLDSLAQMLVDQKDYSSGRTSREISQQLVIQIAKRASSNADSDINTLFGDDIQQVVGNLKS